VVDIDESQLRLNSTPLVVIARTFVCHRIQGRRRGLERLICWNRRRIARDSLARGFPVLLRSSTSLRFAGVGQLNSLISRPRTTSGLSRHRRRRRRQTRLDIPAAAGPSSAPARLRCLVCPRSILGRGILCYRGIPPGVGRPVCAGARLLHVSCEDVGGEGYIGA
jgi:hypothetical protein